MKKTRTGVFETNSSSTHSICIARNVEVKLPDSIHFEFGEFGWENNTLYTVGEKASYLYTGMYANGMETEFGAMVETLRGKGIEVTMEEKSGTSSYFDQGYVDHSNDLADFLEAIIGDEDKLLNYLFSDLSFICTGNDNDDEDVSISVNYDHDSYYKGN